MKFYRVETRHSKDSGLSCTKIYYASRTHTQLAQLLPELRRLRLYPLSTSTTSPTQTWARKRAIVESDQDTCGPQLYTRTVALGSRRQLCINDELRSKSKDLDNDCLELVEGSGHFFD